VVEILESSSVVASVEDLRGIYLYW